MLTNFRMTKSSNLFLSVMIRTIIQNAIHCEFWRRARLGQGNTAHFMNVSTFEHVIAKHRRRIVTFSVKLYSVDVNENDYFSVCLNIIRSCTYVRSACFTLQKTAGPLRDEAAAADFTVDDVDDTVSCLPGTYLL